MRPTSTGTPSKPNTAPNLHPVLQVALGSLELQLEEELSRYRRQRQGRTTRPARSLSFKTNKRRSLDLIAVKPNATQPQAAASPPTSTTPAAQTSDQASVENRAIASPESPLQPATTSSPTPLNHDGTPPAGSPAPKPEAAALARWQPEEHSSETTLAHESGTEPEDYLESSEHLLQSLVDEHLDDTGPRDRDWMDTLLTPLGIGSLLLLLVGSVSLGYVISNPSSLSHLRLSRLGQSDEAGESAGNETGDRSTAQNGEIPTEPNLAAQEFVDLNLGTLSTLPGNQAAPTLSSPSPTASPQPQTSNSPNNTADRSTEASGDDTATANPTPASTASTAASTNPPPKPAPAPQAAPSSSTRAAVPRPAPLPSAAPSSAAPAAPRPAAPRPAAPAPAPAAPVAPAPPPAPPETTAARPAAQAPSEDGNYYYVVTPYSGDQSLSQVRQVVGDAYVRNFDDGARIQVGAFNDEGSAQELVESLDQQGVNAEVRSP